MAEQATLRFLQDYHEQPHQVIAISCWGVHIVGKDSINNESADRNDMTKSAPAILSDHECF